MATKPVIFSVDDDPSVLSAIARDLRKRYSSDYRIMRADSGASALEALHELKTRGDPVALFLVDQRMPAMSGVEFLEQAIPLYPDARRALLTAYADTDAAIAAINAVGVNHYLLKPWDPPEQNLYPVIDDLLDDWRAAYRPGYEGLRVIGHRWSAEAHAIKDFLARNQVPYQYFDVERGDEAVELLQQLQLPDNELPIVILQDGTVLRKPQAGEVAERIGLSRQATSAFYDLVIVGGGPAGLAAAVYGASEGLRTVLIEREATGGQAGTSSRIENYLGFPSGLSGSELARRATAQAKRFGVEILSPQEAVSLRIEEPYKFIQLVDGSEIACHALVVAVGLAYRKLDVLGIDALEGKGVYYGASLTEALNCENQPVFVVGAGNSAGQAAIYLSDYASKVIILVRGDSLGDKMSQYLVERIDQSDKIDVMLNSEVAAVYGDDNLQRVTVVNRQTRQESDYDASGLFIFIGATPGTQWLGDAVLRDGKGFVLTGGAIYHDGKLPRTWNLDREPFMLESSVPGIFVVGDVRADSVKRVASAVGEGSIAVRFIHEHLSMLR